MMELLRDYFNTTNLQIKYKYTNNMNVKVFDNKVIYKELSFEIVGALFVVIK